MAVTWSLAVEEQFYLTAPLIVRRLSRKRLVYMLAAIVFLAPILRVLLVFTFHQDCLAAYVLMPCRADALCLGMLSAILVRDADAWGILIRNRILLYWATVAGLACVAWLSYQGYGFDDRPVATFGYSVLAFFYAGCLLIALMETRVGQQFLCDRRLARLGGISYCVYLLHLPLIEACRFILVILFQRLGIQFRHAGGIVLLLGALLGITLTLVLAQLSWRLLEQPMLRRGHQYKY